MTKIKNVDLKENYSSLKKVKEGKIKKSKNIATKKLKDVAAKEAGHKLVPKISCSNDIGDKTRKTKEVKIGSKSNLLAELKNQKELIDTKNKLPTKISSEDKTKADLKKIEKKKAKKLALKLKKKQKKIQNKNFEKATAGTLNSDKEINNSLGQKVENIKKELNKKHILVNGEQKTQSLEIADKNVNVTSSEVLTKKTSVKRRLLKDQKLDAHENKSIDEIRTKKEKQFIKRQLIKDSKLGNAENKNIDAVSSKILAKKEKNVIKRELVKDKKLENAVNKKEDEANGEVVTKKEEKFIKRELIKDQKLKTAGNKNVDVASSNVLIKKEKKALKRQLIKDQKLAEKQTRDPALEEATVFVGNLPPNTKRVQIQRIFKNFGPVNCIRLRSAGGKVLYKHKQRKLAGSLNAYVVLQSKEKASNALSLNGFEFKGNHLRITLASEKAESQDNSEAKRTVFVGNLKYSATEEPLREIFSSCGIIEYVRCIRDGDKGCKGVAYVRFKTADAVGLALELNETIVDERPIHIERFNIKKLGAKKAREDEKEKEGKLKKGAKLRLEGGENKKEKSNHKLATQNEIDDAKKSKKSEFRGVKVNGLKKKQKQKKKKSNNEMIQLAKKIAPKAKN